MGHTFDGHAYRKLGEKVDGLTVRAPWNDTLHGILEELYTPDEADLVIDLPYGPSTFERIREITGLPEAKLKSMLEALCAKGLVMDVFINDSPVYMPSPMVVGIFEFTMMRTDAGVDHKKMAGLFKDYLASGFMQANFRDGSLSVMRSLPHEAVIDGATYVEVLDYDKATAIVEQADRFSMGLCSCRHEKLHLGEKTCEVPLGNCSSFGIAAEYLIRNNLAKEVSKTEMLENVARSKELGLVLNADNVKKDITYICHCCGCCCNVLQGISKYGCTSMVVTSGYAPKATDDCEGCGKCARACPIHAIEMVRTDDPRPKKKKRPKVDTTICLGCGVCAMGCKTGALKLHKADKRAIYPEDTFERVILQCLDKGTLQNQLFDNPRSMTHRFMGGVVGGFLRLSPVKRALMSDALRSTFLASLKAGVRLQGKGWMLEL